MYYRFVKSISFSIFLITSIYGCYVTFGVKSNQKRGGCDSPAPHKRCTSVECCVCYKSRKFETSFVSLIRSTNFFAIFVKIFQPTEVLEIFLLSADSAIVIRGKYFPEPLSVHQIQIYPTDSNNFIQDQILVQYYGTVLLQIYIML